VISKENEQKIVVALKHCATNLYPDEGMKAFVEKRPADYVKLRTMAREGKSSEFPWGPYSLTCPGCGTKNLPDQFSHCGACGKKLAVMEKTPLKK